MFICKTDRRLAGRFTPIVSVARLPLVLEDYFNERMSSVYTDLVAYWGAVRADGTTARMVANTSRLNQSEVFIAEQLKDALRALHFVTNRIRARQAEDRFNRNN